MKNFHLARFMFITLLFASPLMHAGETKHFKGKKPTHYIEAIQLIDENNKKIHALTQKENITIQDLGKIHMMTYTLENSLQKMKNDIQTIEIALEKLHKASEKTNTEKANKLAKQYLDIVKVIIKK